MNPYPTSMEQAHNNLLAAFERIKKVGFWSRLFKTKYYEREYRNFVDAVRDGSAWLEHGKGSDEELSELWNHQRLAEDYLLAYLVNPESHPWGRGTR